MNRILATALLATTLATAAQAATDLIRDPAQVQGGHFAVEPAHTQVAFGVSHMGFTTYYGHFSDASGTLDLNAAKPSASQLDVTIPTATITTTSAKLNDELKSAQWFDAAKYPTITFHSTKVVRTGKTEARIEGELTLHGVTKPITLVAHFNGAGTNPLDKNYTVGFQATGKIKRSDFGVSTYVPLIGDEVDLILSGAFERQG
jgi:polyisoprenoid-binding protein YceI